MPRQPPYPSRWWRAPRGPPEPPGSRRPSRVSASCHLGGCSGRAEAGTEQSRRPPLPAPALSSAALRPEMKLPDAVRGKLWVTPTPESSRSGGRSRSLPDEASSQPAGIAGLCCVRRAQASCLQGVSAFSAGGAGRGDSGGGRAVPVPQPGDSCWPHGCGEWPFPPIPGDGRSPPGPDGHLTSLSALAVRGLAAGGGAGPGSARGHGARPAPEGPRSAGGGGQRLSPSPAPLPLRCPRGDAHVGPVQPRPQLHMRIQLRVRPALSSTRGAVKCPRSNRGYGSKGIKPAFQSACGVVPYLAPLKNHS